MSLLQKLETWLEIGSRRARVRRIVYLSVERELRSLQEGVEMASVILRMWQL